MRALRMLEGAALTRSLSAPLRKPPHAASKQAARATAQAPAASPSAAHAPAHASSRAKLARTVSDSDAVFKFSQLRDAAKSVRQDRDLLDDEFDARAPLMAKRAVTRAQVRAPSASASASTSAGLKRRASVSPSPAAAEDDEEEDDDDAGFRKRRYKRGRGPKKSAAPAHAHAAPSPAPSPVHAPAPAPSSSRAAYTTYEKEFQQRILLARPSLKDAKQQISNVRRIRKLLDLPVAIQSARDLDFLLDFASSKEAIDKIADKPARRGVYTSAHNACFTLAKDAENAIDRATWEAVAKRYIEVSTALNKDVADEHTFEASAKQLKIFQTIAQLRTWYDAVRADALSAIEDAGDSLDLSDSAFKAVMLLVLVAMEFGGFLGPVRGNELAKLFVSSDVPEDSAATRVASRNWLIQTLRAIWYNVHKSDSHHHQVHFLATRSWQLPFWEDLALYVPYLRHRLNLDEDAPAPVFINVKTNAQLNARQISLLLQESSREHLGVALGTQALRTLYDSHRPHALGGEDYLPLEERAKQSLHTVAVLLKHYIKDFKGEAGTAQILSDLAALQANAAINASRLSKHDLRAITNDTLVALATYLKALHVDGYNDKESEDEDAASAGEREDKREDDEL